MATEVDTRTIPAGDRELCIEVAGDGPAGTVVVCGGTPNSRRLYHRWVEDALRRGLRLVGYDRPGYGGSTPHPGRTVADGAEEVRAIAAALGVERLAVWGYSGGGPYAIACAALLQDLVVASCSVCSLAPYGAPGLDFFTDMGEDNVEDTKLMFSDPEAAREKVRKDWEVELQVTTETIVEEWRSLLSSVDAAALTGEFADYVVGCTQAGMTVGDEGWWEDSVAHLSAWGFDLDAIRMPFKVWHGREDRFVPIQHGEWLAEHIPGAEAELTDDDGHLTLLINRIPDVHEWLLGHL
jgi:pimeloyl-ACP methyl ester carboxylesterase